MLSKKGLCANERFEAKISVLFRPRLTVKGKHICKVGFLEKAILRKQQQQQQQQQQEEEEEEEKEEEEEEEQEEEQ